MDKGFAPVMRPCALVHQQVELERLRRLLSSVIVIVIVIVRVIVLVLVIALVMVIVSLTSSSCALGSLALRHALRRSRHALRW